MWKSHNTYLNNLVFTSCLSLYHFFKWFTYEFQFNHIQVNKKGSHFIPKNSSLATHSFKWNRFDWILDVLFSTANRSSPAVVYYDYGIPILSTFWKHYQNILVQSRKTKLLFLSNMSGAKYRSQTIIFSLVNNDSML